MKFYVIGISDAPNPQLSPEALAVVGHGRVFSGGRRHHALVGHLLPTEAVWIDITAPLEAVFAQYERMDTDVVVFASGDPLFFGFANTIRRFMPAATVQLFPTFNSLQLLAHRLVLPYHDMRIVSLTGRPWPELDRALIERAPKIGVLTDGEHTPAAIARRMLDYGYTTYRMHVGEHLGHPAQEHVSTLPLQEAALQDFAMPNCLILEATQALSPRPFGIPDTAFSLLDGREKMITKMPIRLLTLQMLDLPSRHVLWDIGACTGSISIEARLRFPHLQVEAFEIRPECEAIIHDNARRFGAPGIGVHIGDFLESGGEWNADIGIPQAPTPTSHSSSVIRHSSFPISHSSFPISHSSLVISHSPSLPPDAIFIGGHGGRLKEMMAKAVSCLQPGGIIVMNSVTSAVVTQATGHRPSSRQLWDEACHELGLQQEAPLHIQLNDYNPIEILKCRK